MPSSSHNTLILCGSSEVVRIDTVEPGRRVWRWSAADRAELPPAVRPLFKYTADCKPVNGGRQILIPSSSDGVALVDRATGQVDSWAVVPNAHSADLLSDGRIVVASSSRGRIGDRLIVFEPGRPMRAVRTLPFYSAHGVVADGERNKVWALGFDSLRAYDSHAWTVTGEWPLPDPQGHDLSPVPGSNLLAVTTAHLCLLFDRDRLAFEPHPLVGSAPRIKSYAQNASGRIALVQSVRDTWWGTTIRLVDPEGEIECNSSKLYKARWCPPLSDIGPKG